MHIFIYIHIPKYVISGSKGLAIMSGIAMIIPREKGQEDELIRSNLLNWWMSSGYAHWVSVQLGPHSHVWTCRHHNEHLQLGFLMNEYIMIRSMLPTLTEEQAYRLQIPQFSRGIPSRTVWCLLSILRIYIYIIYGRIAYQKHTNHWQT